jgi:hypothetical protein
MPATIQDFTGAIPGVFADSTGKTAPLLSGFVQRSIQQRYSVDSPLVVTSDVAGTGKNYLPVPVAPGEGNDLPVWESDFSIIRRIEFPIGQQPPQLILDSDFRVYSTPGQPDQILIDFDSPSPQDSIRVTWTARHLADGSTIPGKDFFALVDFAASLAAEYMATYYVNVGDPTLSADVTNYRTKSQEMQGVAKMLRKRYFNHMGIEEGATGQAEIGPALALGNQFLEQNSGVDRLVHGKYTR